AGNANTLAVARTCLDADFEWFSLCEGALAMAGGAGRQIPARAVTARTLQVELLPPASLRDLPGPVAFREFSRSLEEAPSVTVWVSILPRDIEAQDTAA